MNNKLQDINYLSSKKTVIFGFSLLLIAITAISFGPIFVKLSITEIGAKATVFNRFWIATVIFGLWNFIDTISQKSSAHTSSDDNHVYTYKVIGLLLLMGSLFAGIHLLWAWSLSQTSVANSITILHGLRPLLTVLGGWLFFKKFFDLKFLTGMIIAIAGAILIGFNDFSDSMIKLEGDLLSVISAVLSALELLIMEHLLTKFTTKILMFWCCLVATLVTVIILIVTDNHFFPISLKGWLAVIALALCSQVIGQGLITYSLNYLSSGLVAIIMLIDPVLSTILAWSILSEQLSIANSIFCSIVLFGIYLSLSSQYALKKELVS
ncbi:protein of unknown function DUF6, transmembrane [Trichodesmium erythraeum IMS101]|uniref:EamA domain-containing protein n=1 Tax=Trichodesmium erythraeum (strain IMS101) TaxID=203124 RepID=Q10ZS0_TRIEI|nr:DMT family transporter [Trichodesmium erythraeum GBRTRLIN201]